MSSKRVFVVFLTFTFLLVSCSIWPGATIVTPVSESTGIATDIATASLISASADSTITPTPFQPVFEPKKGSIYWSSAVPQEWIRDFDGLQVTTDPINADLRLGIGEIDQGEVVFGTFQRIFAVGVPFPTVTDNIRGEDLKAIWQGGGSQSGEFKRLFIDDDTKTVFTEIWGESSDSSVTVVNKDDLVSEVWQTTDAMVIVPFEDVEPRLKVLRVDGISVFDRPMNTTDYALTVAYTLSGSNSAFQTYPSEITQLLSVIPASNRDESKMTVVVMSGTTALARVTLKKIELNGYDYPIELVKDWFLSADLRHVSNEVSFDDDCVYTDPYTMQFCSKPDQIKVLENLGINVVESTGNHLNDYGSDEFERTLQMYQERGWLNFGGGLNAELARQPVTTEVNGNRIAFIGCNPVGFETVWATETRAGAAKCDYDWFHQQITELKSEGYVVIATFQETEIDLPMYEGKYRTPFKEAAMAGADIVQGSQAHVPMGFEFVGDSLIHYGLGNFLFDQMEPVNKREFVDRHIIYDGKYMGTELLTATLTDWSRPVPMDESQRSSFLTEMFSASEMR